MSRVLSKVAVGALVLVLAAQVVPYGRAHSNPPVTGQPEWDSPETKALFDRACADCHSHETKWPWYANIAPVSWLVTHDVHEGREHFNVSAWGVQDRNEGDEAAEVVEAGEMPLVIYTPLHPEARLSEPEKAKLVAGLKATFAGGHGAPTSDDEARPPDESAPSPEASEPVHSPEEAESEPEQAASE